MFLLQFTGYGTKHMLYQVDSENSMLNNTTGIFQYDLNKYANYISHGINIYYSILNSCMHFKSYCFFIQCKLYINIHKLFISPKY